MATDFIHGVEVVEVLDGTRPIATPRFSIGGTVGTAPEADADAFPLDTPVLVRSAFEASKLGATGTLVDGVRAFLTAGGGTLVVVRVEEGADTLGTLAKVAGDAILQTGIHALRAAQSLLGVTPRILFAPGHTHFSPSGGGNPVIAEMVSVCQALRAMGWADAPVTSVADAKAHANDIGSDRITPIYPLVNRFDTQLARNVVDYPSGYAAGIEASLPVHVSASNRIMPGIVQVTRPIEHRPQDPDSLSNELNAVGVATIINQGGFRLWGNRSTGSDPLTVFRTSRRSMDAAAVALERSHDWATDRPITPQLAVTIISGVNSYLRRQQSLGAIAGGQASLNPDLNTSESLRAGRLYVDFDLEPSVPLERLTFTMYRNGEYFDALVDAVITATEQEA